MRKHWAGAVVALAAVVIAAGCTSKSNQGSSAKTSDLSGADPGKCVTVDMAVSSEKIALVTDLAKQFNADKANKVGGKCVFVRPAKKASGAAATLLQQGWPEPDRNGAQPVIWSPASSGWLAILNQRLADAGKPPMAPPSKPFMLTPLAIAMPKPMAEALGYPNTPLGIKDLVDLANDPAGWAKYGHPEWGAFKLGKTNPNFSTSGLNFTISEYYAATGKTRGLTSEDLDRPDVEAFAKGVESAVVHYGDIVMTFLNNWYREDARSAALSYASAVVIEEKSIIDYNKGNPDGELSPGEVPTPPKIPLVAIYPKEGTLFSDSPFVVLDAPWVTPEQKAAGALFRDYVLRPENQQKVLQYGFRPGNPQVPVAAPISPEFGVDPNQPQAVVEVPDPPVLTKILDKWDEQRKTARVMLVIDVSGSMSDKAAPNSKDTKLDLAKRAAVSALSQFKDDDEVGLRIFSTGLPGTARAHPWLDLMPVAPIGPNRDALAKRIEGLVPVQGTPLYDVTAASYQDMVEAYDKAKINAVVLLTDGYNDDGQQSDDDAQLQALIGELQKGHEGVNDTPVRIFPIAYGKDADLGTLRQIADATNATVYDASNPASIEDVFAAVVSNF